MNPPCPCRVEPVADPSSERGRSRNRLHRIAVSTVLYLVLECAKIADFVERIGRAVLVGRVAMV